MIMTISVAVVVAAVVGFLVVWQQVDKGDYPKYLKDDLSNLTAEELAEVCDLYTRPGFRADGSQVLYFYSPAELVIDIDTSREYMWPYIEALERECRAR